MHIERDSLLYYIKYPLLLWLDFQFIRSKHAVTDRSERTVPVVPARNTRQLIQYRRKRFTTDVHHAVHRQEVHIHYC